MALPSRQTAGRKEKMENNVMENAYMTYDGQIRVDREIIIISLWNKFIEEEGNKSGKIFKNNEEFFKNSFKNSYDAAMAVSLSGAWRWTDDFVYFNDEGYLTSFSRCDDKTCPIVLDKIDIDYLIRALQDLQTNDKKRQDNISRAIHDALK